MYYIAQYNIITYYNIINVKRLSQQKQKFFGVHNNFGEA